MQEFDAPLSSLFLFPCMVITAQEPFITSLPMKSSWYHTGRPTHCSCKSFHRLEGMWTFCYCWYGTLKLPHASLPPQPPFHLCVQFLGLVMHPYTPSILLILYWPEAVMCCRTLYPHLGGVATVKNNVCHETWLGLCSVAARPGTHDARTSSASLVAGFIESKNKGLSCLESFFFSRQFFRIAPKAFLLGLWGDRGGDSER